MLASISGAKNVLEIGTFTGYSALCFAEGIKSNNNDKNKKQNKDVPINMIEKEVEIEVEKDILNGNDNLENNSKIPIFHGKEMSISDIDTENEIEGIKEGVVLSRKVRGNEKRKKINEKIANNIRELNERKIGKINVDIGIDRKEKELNLRFSTLKERREIEKRNRIIAKIENRKEEFEKRKFETLIVSEKNIKSDMIREDSSNNNNNNSNDDNYNNNNDNNYNNNDSDKILNIDDGKKEENAPKIVSSNGKFSEIKEEVSIASDITNKIMNNDIQIKERSSARGSVVTCEMDSTAAAVALSHFDQSDYKDDVSYKESILLNYNYKCMKEHQLNFFFIFFLYEEFTIIMIIVFIILIMII